MDHRMNNKKKHRFNACMEYGVLFCAAFVLVLCLYGCKADPGRQNTDGKLTVVATVFPVYDWAREVLGDAENVELILLTKNGVDMHSFQPSAADLMTVSRCDVLLYVGGESEAWIGDALRTGTNPDRVAVNLLAALGEAAREEELQEGMQGDADGGLPGQDAGAGDHRQNGESSAEDGDAGAEYDEHIWLSLRNAETLTGVIRDTFCEKDPAHENLYKSNAEAYTKKLQELDRLYVGTAAKASFDTLLFADRFPFLYLLSDYGIRYYAAFPGCSAETEASFGTVIFLAGKMDELKLPCVLILDGSTGDLAKTVIRNTEKKDQEILVLQSMQSVSLQDAENGVSYLSLMEENLAVLKKALRAE